MTRQLRLIWILLLICNSASAVRINEIRIDQPGEDDDEYFELVGSPGQPLNGLTYLVIGDGPTALGSGVIEAVVPLSGLEIPESGYFLAAKSTFGAPGTVFDGIVPTLITNLNFENNANRTHLLVSDFFGSLNDNLDLNNNGVLDIQPWGGILDAVGLVHRVDPNLPGMVHYYGASLGFVDVGPDGNFVPAHVYRFPDQSGDWAMGSFSLDPNQVTVRDTPGAPNSPPVADPQFTCEWVDNLVAEIVAGTHSPTYDMNGDGLVNHDDLAAWLVVAGAALNNSGNPFLHGDANLDGTVDGQDFIVWNTNRFTNTPAWCSGDFNADGVVDGQDFVLWSSFRFMSSDGLAVPEPGMLPSMWLALLSIAVSRTHRHSLGCKASVTHKLGSEPIGYSRSSVSVCAPKSRSVTMYANASLGNSVGSNPVSATAGMFTLSR